MSRWFVSARRRVSLWRIDGVRADALRKIADAILTLLSGGWVVVVRGDAGLCGAVGGRVGRGALVPEFPVAVLVLVDLLLHHVTARHPAAAVSLATRRN